MSRLTAREPLLALGGLVVLLGALTPFTGLDARGWAVGLGCGIGLLALVVRSMTRHSRTGLGPADRVTMTRAVLSCAVAALVAGHANPGTTATLVTLSVAAIVLDGVDGRVARRTGTASAFGARFDMEVDAFLILVLSIDVARTTGAWVLSLGLARYLFLGAGVLVPWLRETPPARRWAKVVAVAVAVVLTLAASGILPDPVAVVTLGITVVLLSESFGHSVWQLWRMHAGRPFPRAAATAALALILLWASLLVPDQLAGLSPWTFLSIPVEGLVFVGLVLALPRAGAPVALLGGFALAALTILRMLDMGFRVAFDAPFHVVYDTSYAGPAVGLLTTSMGRAGAWAIVLAAGVTALGLLAMLPWAALRVTRLVHGHRMAATAALAVLSGIAVGSAALGARHLHDGPELSTAAATAAYTQVTQAHADLRDQGAFTAALDQGDPLESMPSDTLLQRLRGKDVLLVFVESYGRTALDDPTVTAALADGQRRLASAGLTARSGWLTSPTFGGGSWLAHSTLQSGLWVDNQRRFQRLMTTQRFTLTEAFGRAGWHTVVVAPEVPGPWPEATTFYHYDQVIDQESLGYAGPQFSWAAMPDQYTLATFQRLVLDAPHRAAVMAEINLVSSHWPWAPLPKLVDWNQLGDGSIFGPMAAHGTTPASLARDPHLQRSAYADSIAYSLTALTEFLVRLHDPNVVAVVLGDHQPSSVVSGAGADHDVPVSILSSDPAVTREASSWGWTAGLQPDDDAPDWPMDAFRDRFFTGFSHGSTTQRASATVR